MPIRVLPAKVSSAIAAGEVVERPMSVVKELVENALDAGASRLEITVQGAGSKLIEVQDNGAGIPQAEVRLAVERFATSKVQDLGDLDSIATLGFRGEALSSIGAVAHLEVVTRAAGEPTGTRLTMTGGEVEAVAPIGTPQGTVVRVRNLFFNVPVRKEFLKSDSTERRRILALVSRYAIAYPEVAFLLTHEGREVFRSPGTGDPREVLAAVFGLEVAQEMITLPEPPSQEIRVRGFISPPSVHRGSRRELTFFVNGRLVQDSSLAAAVLQAYHGLLMVGRYPLAVIQLALPPDAVDVNIHPGKAEVRFKDSRQVFRVVQRAVRSTLIGQAPPPSLEMTTGWGGESYAGAPRSADPAWHMLRREKEGSSARQADLGSEAGAQVLPLLRAVGQVGTTYLVAEGPDGLYLIDQHAAHERVLFESMMRAFHRGEIESQQLLQAVTVQFLPEQAALMEEQLGALNQLGFDVTIFGRGTFRLRSVPALLTGVDAEGALRAAVEDLQEDERPLEGEVEARIAARVCKRAAIKSGQVLSLEEQRRLIRDLEACESPRTCPHGRPTMVHLSVDALERQFGRRG